MSLGVRWVRQTGHRNRAKGVTNNSEINHRPDYARFGPVQLCNGANRSSVFNFSIRAVGVGSQFSDLPSRRGLQLRWSSRCRRRGHRDRNRKYSFGGRQRRVPDTVPLCGRNESAMRSGRRLQRRRKAGCGDSSKKVIQVEATSLPSPLKSPIAAGYALAGAMARPVAAFPGHRRIAHQSDPHRWQRRPRGLGHGTAHQWEGEQGKTEPLWHGTLLT
jgi:hypothetical protein